MFYHIQGTLEIKGQNFAVIDAGGVGYKIFTSQNSLHGLGETGHTVKMFTYLYVREDLFDLYGFSDSEELRMFELLISVSGVGPKAGLSVLSVLPPHKLALAILSGDTKSITQAQGVGPKVAQRIVLEIKDKLGNEDIQKSAGSGTFVPILPDHDALGALMVLGYSKQQAAEALSGVDMSQDLELIIKDALKRLMK